MTDKTIQQKVAARYRDFYPAFVVLVISLLAIFIVARQIDARYQQRLLEHFNFETERITTILRERMALHGHTLRSAAGLFAGSDYVSRKDWREFVGMLGLDVNHPGVQGLGYSMWIPAVQLRQHLDSVRQQGFPDYVINPLGDREYYTSVIYLEPFTSRNLRAFGYDMFSEPVRRRAMERARDHAELAYTGKVTLLQETNDDIQAGMLAYFPVYRNGTIPQTVDQRRATLVGWVYSPYRMTDLLNGILGKKLYALRLEVFDADNLTAAGLLYDNGRQIVPPGGSVQPDAPTRTLRLDVGGHYWTLRYTALPDFNQTTQITRPWIEISTLALVGVLLFFVALAYISARRNATTAQQLSETLQQSERRFRRLFENTPVAYLALDQHGYILGFNPQLCTLLGYTTDELQGKKLFEFMAAEARQEFELKLQMLNHYGVMETELPLLRKSGHTLTVILDGRLQKNKSGQAVVHCILTNITERKKAENKLQLAARVFGEAHEGITISDATGIIIDANPTFCAITGYPRDEVIGQSHRILKSGRHDNAFYQKLWQSLLTEGHWQGEIWNRKKSGELHVLSVTISAMRNQNGEIINFVGLFSDITQAKLQQQQLEKMAHHDPLTELPNRILFTDRFHQALVHCKRDKTLLGVVYMDLDGFKQVNDSLGHEAGDQLLIEVATRIKASLREEDTVSRLGGDEFALLLSGIESREHCEQVLQRIHQAIVQPYEIDGQVVTIGVSSGVTLYPQDLSDGDSLLRHADQSMYQAKQHGRNRFEFFPADEH
ncbi:CHASE domain-containing protein [Methylomonas montana]|uniref:sensor domain-containing diguanylate cyclase n=1 Tax=Methylomonas montana TaxID=3058963 RepID=UPI0026594802|nr:CHASE domain-containing protein [Methylomonas montana]WKJ91191.1 CHASE domain-containing protein [Methylomonas montana]